MDYPWHKRVWQLVDTMFDQDRLPHALLLWGSAGVGKRLFAQQLAKRILCLSDNMGCNHCQACHWLEKKVHPDFYIIEPQGDKKSIGIEQIRTLKASLTTASTQHAAQLVLIPKAHLLNVSANNAFLKLLEEPPGDIHFLLISDSLNNLPMTILSRCQKLYFPPASDLQVANHLEQNGMDPQYASSLFGAPLLASNYLSELAMLAEQDIIDGLIALTHKKMSPCRVVETWLNYDISKVLGVIWRYFYQVLCDRQGIDRRGLIISKALEKKNYLSKNVSPHKIFTIIDKVVELNEHILLGHPINQTLWLEDLAVEMVG